jgi:hypothetical protein
MSAAHNMHMHASHSGVVLDKKYSLDVLSVPIVCMLAALALAGWLGTARLAVAAQR